MKLSKVLILNTQMDVEGEDIFANLTGDIQTVITSLIYMLLFLSTPRRNTGSLCVGAVTGTKLIFMNEIEAHT